MTFYERYNTGIDAYTSLYGDKWRAETFTIGNTGTNEAHDITSVKLLSYRTGSPGTVTVSIRAVDGDGLPTGADLTSGTLDGNTFTTELMGLWYEFGLTPYGLSAATKYAIVSRVTAGDVGNNAKWRRDQASPTYTGGNRCDSTDAGVTWIENLDNDYSFEEYGFVPVTGQFLQPTRYW